MPSLPTPLEPRPLDPVAVAAAAAACTGAAAALGALVEARSVAAAVARQAWRGPARERFDADLARLDGEAAALLAELARAASGIGAAAELAAAERRRAGPAEAPTHPRLLGPPWR